MQKFLLAFSFFNLFVLAMLGLTLRAYPVVSLPVLYKNLLHAHSHFAFAGWIMPLLIALITRYFPSCSLVDFKHWRNIIFMQLLSAYGMLGSMPFQGYGAVSLFFSTLSIAASVYLAAILWKCTAGEKDQVAEKFLRAGLFYMVLSSIGPFGTVPLIVMGQQGSNLYFDAVYFYLHLQYNGWFIFALLAAAYKIIGEKGLRSNGQRVFRLMNYAVLPAFFLSTLWHHPHASFYIIGLIAATLQVIALPFLITDLNKLRKETTLTSFLLTAAMVALVIKTLLQFASAFPLVADLAYATRNFMIAYLHLVLIGLVSFGCLSLLLRDLRADEAKLKTGLILFFQAFVVTEILLVLQGISTIIQVPIPLYTAAIFIATIGFPFGAAFLTLSVLSFSWKQRLAGARTMAH